MWSMLMDTPGLKWRLLATLVIGVFMGALDLTILAPALPHISASLEVSPAAVVLAFSIYAAFYATSVPLMGKLADIRGYKPVYATSMMLFAGGSALAAVAPSLPVLVGARIVQGVGGGGLFPVAQAIVGVALPEERRGKVLGLLMGVFAVGGVLGPNVGGFLTQHFSWSYIFWINVPLGLLGAALLYGTELPGRKQAGLIDWKGAILVALFFGSLIIGIERLRSLGDFGFFTWRVGGVFALAGISLLLLVPVERRVKDPILNFEFIFSRSLAPVLLISFLVGYALLSGAVFVPFYAQLVFGATTLGSGAVLNAAAVGLGVSSWIAGTYTNREAASGLVITGMGLSALGLAVMVLFRLKLWGLLAGLVFLGAGTGLVQGPISYLSLLLVPSRNEGQVSGLVAITRTMGGAAGIAWAGVVLSRASRGLINLVPESGDLAAQVWGSSSSLQALKNASPALQQTVQNALGKGLVEGWYWALGAAVLGLFVTLLVRKQDLRAEPEPLVS